MLAVLGLIEKTSHNYIKLCETKEKIISNEIERSKISSDFLI